MKEFITVFLSCFILGYIGITIFETIDNFWNVYIAITFFVTLLITSIIKLVIKIEDIEKKLKTLNDYALKKCAKNNYRS